MGRNNIGERAREGGKLFQNIGYDHLGFKKKIHYTDFRK
jgi:hypothetical protein